MCIQGSNWVEIGPLDLLGQAAPLAAFRKRRKARYPAAWIQRHFWGAEQLPAFPERHRIRIAPPPQQAKITQFCDRCYGRDGSSLSHPIAQRPPITVVPNPEGDIQEHSVECGNMIRIGPQRVGRWDRWPQHRRPYRLQGLRRASGESLNRGHQATMPSSIRPRVAMTRSTPAWVSRSESGLTPPRERSGCRSHCVAPVASSSTSWARANTFSVR